MSQNVESLPNETGVLLKHRFNKIDSCGDTISQINWTQTSDLYKTQGKSNLECIVVRCRK